jgi:hypothetical protein
MTNAKGASANTKLAKVGTKSRHDKAPHPIKDEGLSVRNPYSQ